MIRIIDDTHFELIRYNLFRKGNFPGTFVFALPPDLKGTVEKKRTTSEDIPAGKACLRWKT